MMSVESDGVFFLQNKMCSFLKQGVYYPHWPFWHSYHVIHSSVLLTDYNIVNRFFSYRKRRDLNPRAIALTHLISLPSTLLFSTQI
jgi:hypothetical protein